MLQSGYKSIQQEIGAFLGSYGFRPYKAATLYRTTGNDLLQFLSFQKGTGSLSNQMTINIVQQGLFVPGSSFGVLQPGCRIGQFVGAAQDKWWYCGEDNSIEQTVEEIRDILLSGVLPFFDFSAESQNIPWLATAGQYAFLWWAPTTFIDKGYFYLKAELYDEAIQCWEKHQPGKVPKFKNFKSLVQQGNQQAINDLLEENVRHTRTKLGI